MNDDSLSNNKSADNQKLSSLEKDLDSLMEKAKKEVSPQESREVNTEQNIKTPQIPDQQPQVTTQDPRTNIANNTAYNEDDGRVVNQVENSHQVEQNDQFSSGKSKKIIYIAVVFFVLSLAGLGFYFIGAAEQGRIVNTPTPAPSYQTTIPRPTIVEETPDLSENGFGEGGVLTTASPSASPIISATPSAVPTSTPSI